MTTHQPINVTAREMPSDQGSWIKPDPFSLRQGRPAKLKINKHNSLKTLFYSAVMMCLIILVLVSLSWNRFKSSLFIPHGGIHGTHPSLPTLTNRPSFAVLIDNSFYSFKQFVNITKNCPTLFSYYFISFQFCFFCFISSQVVKRVRAWERISW